MIDIIRCHGCGKFLGVLYFKNHIRAYGILCWKCYKGNEESK